jgi:hypothetical protein
LRVERLEDRRLLSITVNSLVDEADGSIVDGDISLRDAIVGAAQGEIIDFSIIGRINLTLGHITINKNLTITGPGAGLLTIDAAGNDPTPDQNNGDGSRVFDIGDNISFAVTNVSVSGLSLTGGDVAVGGGAIRSVGANLTISGSTINGNSALSGGGVDIVGGPLRATVTIRNSTISGNSATTGGGIFHQFTQLTVTDSTIHENSATADGGGIGGANSTLMVTKSLIHGNSAIGDGGGILSGSENMVTISRTTVSGNSATGNGGGIEDENGVLTVVDSTISGNTAGSRGGGIRTSNLAPPFVGQPRIVNCTVSGNTAGETGGGIFSNSGHSMVRHSTITGNSAPNGSGVGASSYSSRPGYPGSRIDFHSTIIAGNANSDLNYVARPAASGNPFRSNGYNLVGTGDGSTAFVQPGDQIGVMNPMLDPLANNGGPTRTHALRTGSPAMNAGDPGAVPGMNGVPEFDQRGAPFTRVSGGRIDIGSNEQQPIPPAVFGDYSQNGVVDTADYIVWRKSLNQSVAPFSSADSDGDGVVDGDDYGIWRAHFGQTLPMPTVASGALDRLTAAATAGQTSSGNNVAALADPSADLLQPLAFSVHGAERLPVVASAISPLRGAIAFDVADHKELLLAYLSILGGDEEEQFNVRTISPTDDGLANRSTNSLDAFDKAFELVGNPARSP